MVSWKVILAVKMKGQSEKADTLGTTNVIIQYGSPTVHVRK